MLDASKTHQGQKSPLEGLVVVDLSRYIAGPYCTMLMADAGATVIKVEPPLGDDTRHLGPFIESGCGESVSAYFIRMNRGKRSIALDLKDDVARGILEKLIVEADVLVENYAAGVFARLGFGADRVFELNPSLVYCSISGFGHTPSPLRDRAAYNVVAEYEAGVFHHSEGSDLPSPVGPPVGDMFPALHALGGLTMALYRRAITGEGARVDIAMYDSMLSLNEIRSTYSILYDREWDPVSHPFYSPYGVFPVRDGHVCVDVTTDGQWEGFCRAIGHPEMFELPGLTTGPERVGRYESVIRAPFEAWLAQQTRDSAVETLAAHRVPCAAIRAPGEALNSDQARARDMSIQVQGDHGVTITTVGNPIKIDDDSSVPRPAAPVLDGDRDWVLDTYLAEHSVSPVPQ